MPIGYLISVALMAWCTLFAVALPRARQSSPPRLSLWFGYLVNELSCVACYWLVASTSLAIGQGEVDSRGGWAVFPLAVATTCGLGLVACRGLRAGAALDQAVGAGRRTWNAESLEDTCCA